VVVPSPHIDDPGLVNRARRGETAAIAELIDRHYAPLLAACRRALGNPDAAADAAQQASLTAMLALDRLRDEERFGAWLIGIGLNVCRSMLRATRRQPVSLEAFLSSGTIAEPAGTADDDPAIEAERRETAAGIRSAIATLPAGQREAVALFYLAGLTHAEAAEELGIRPGALKARLHKARTSMRAPLHQLWKEQFAMTTQPTEELVPMRIIDLRRTARTDADVDPSHIIFLNDEAGERSLRIWIGEAEATSLATILEDVQLPRPTTYHFAAELLGAARAKLREVRIVRLTERVFYAEAILGDGTKIDARPSDALTLASLTGAPILVAPTVLDAVAADRSPHLEQLAEEANAAEDDARAIAAEVTARIEAETARRTGR
jgi:RNA polymerase sigma factor (sigma-70 family)